MTTTTTNKGRTSLENWRTPKQQQDRGSECIYQATALVVFVFQQWRSFGGKHLRLLEFDWYFRWKRNSRQGTLLNPWEGQKKFFVHERNVFCDLIEKYHRLSTHGLFCEEWSGAGFIKFKLFTVFPLLASKVQGRPAGYGKFLTS